MSERDYIDALLHSEAETPHEVGGLNVLGIPSIRAMAVPSRASCSAEIEAREAEGLQYEQVAVPIPFWDSDGSLEPLNSFDLAALKTVGLTPEQWETAVLEEALERRRIR